jgi:hypothetical protein
VSVLTRDARDHACPTARVSVPGHFGRWVVRFQVMGAILSPKMTPTEYLTWELSGRVWSLPLSADSSWKYRVVGAGEIDDGAFELPGDDLR